VTNDTEIVKVYEDKLNAVDHLYDYTTKKGTVNKFVLNEFGMFEYGYIGMFSSKTLFNIYKIHEYKDPSEIDLSALSTDGNNSESEEELIIKIN